MDATLLVMAAGAGSRFGGLKQMEPIGKNGEVLLDYSVFDAKNAGFSKVVFVIKKSMEEDFKAIIGKRCEKYIDVEYAFQEGDDLPGGFTLPKGRTKPWGTVQAVLSAKDKINTPFAVINSDDYYGKSVYKYITEHFEKSKEMCMVAYDLEKTLSDNGTVTRGVCDIKDGYLAKITEHYNLDKSTNLTMDTKVSMNIWGFYPDIFDKLEAGFVNFLKNLKDEMKDEYILPVFVDEIIKSENAKIKVLSTKDSWIGMTYREDLPFVKEAMQKLDYKF
ncbi:MAG: nucleotidyltransferase [Ruminococcaceae bacterium]|nr:nucleotidyltransferase [Oscillospiraceae bacterium]